MEQVYQKNVETSLSAALPDIVYYMVAGLACGTILEGVMPKYDEEKDNIALFLEIFAQIALIIFAFMFINSKAGGRNGFIVYVLVLVGCQPSLFEKIGAFRKGLVGIETTQYVKEEIPTPAITIEEEKPTPTVQTSGATSIDNLPKV